MDTQDIINLLNTQHSAIEKRLTADAKAAGDAVADLKASMTTTQARLMGLEQAVSAGGNRGGGGLGGAPARQSWGSQLVSHERFTSWLAGGATGKIRVPIKAEISVPSGTEQADLVPAQRDEIAPLGRQALTVRDLITAIPTTSNKIEFLQQVSRDVAARGVADGEMKPESAVGMQVAGADVITLAHFLDAPRATLEDIPSLQILCDQDLRWGLGQVEEIEILGGDGTPQHLRGLIPSAQPYDPDFVIAAETGLDRLLLGIVQAGKAGLHVDAVCLHPITWAQLVSTKAGDDDHYVAGAAGGPFGTIGNSVWQVRVVQSWNMERGTALCGAFRMGCRLHDRLLPEVLLSNESGDNFKRNMITLRAEERVALSVRSPDSFVYLDELGSGLTG